ncbi:hypothetical protein GQ42DRAFT_163496 [Ramicandelaber brevisporus]|nr:hypothetical protein GQ42DRAFT_163496 [Ramicandelaber brevisporus]
MDLDEAIDGLLNSGLFNSSNSGATPPITNEADALLAALINSTSPQLSNNSSSPGRSHSIDLLAASATAGASSSTGTAAVPNPFASLDGSTGGASNGLWPSLELDQQLLLLQQQPQQQLSDSGQTQIDGALLDELLGTPPDSASLDSWLKSLTDSTLLPGNFSFGATIQNVDNVNNSNDGNDGNDDNDDDDDDACSVDSDSSDQPLRLTSTIAGTASVNGDTKSTLPTPPEMNDDSSGSDIASSYSDVPPPRKKPHQETPARPIHPMPASLMSPTGRKVVPIMPASTTRRQSTDGPEPSVVPTVAYMGSPAMSSVQSPQMSSPTPATAAVHQTKSDKSSAVMQIAPSSKQPTPNTAAAMPIMDKRQERLMKNRASAYESRKRKREHMESLETENVELKERISKLVDQISKLTKERDSLSTECQKLRTENSSLRKGQSVAASKATSTTKSKSKKTAPAAPAAPATPAAAATPASSMTISKTASVSTPPETHFLSSLLPATIVPTVSPGSLMDINGLGTSSIFDSVTSPTSMFQLDGFGLDHPNTPPGSSPGWSSSGSTGSGDEMALRSPTTTSPSGSAASRLRQSAPLMLMAAMFSFALFAIPMSQYGSGGSNSNGGSGMVGYHRESHHHAHHHQNGQNSPRVFEAPAAQQGSSTGLVLAFDESRPPKTNERSTRSPRIQPSHDRLAKLRSSLVSLTNLPSNLLSARFSTVDLARWVIGRLQFAHLINSETQIATNSPVSSSQQPAGPHDVVTWQPPSPPPQAPVKLEHQQQHTVAATATVVIPSKSGASPTSSSKNSVYAQSSGTQGGDIAMLYCPILQHFIMPQTDPIEPYHGYSTSSSAPAITAQIMLSAATPGPILRAPKNVKSKTPPQKLFDVEPVPAKPQQQRQQYHHHQQNHYEDVDDFDEHHPANHESAESGAASGHTNNISLTTVNGGPAVPRPRIALFAPLHDHSNAPDARYPSPWDAAAAGKFSTESPLNRNGDKIGTGRYLRLEMEVVDSAVVDASNYAAGLLPMA